MKSIIKVIMAVLFILTGCMNEEEVGPPPMDIGTIIQQYADQLTADGNEIQHSKAMVTLASYQVVTGNAFRLPLDFSMDNFSFYYPDLRRMEEANSFDFEGLKGTYDWDPGSGSFIKSAEESGFIEVNFPASAGNQVNNAGIKILRYEENLVTEERGMEVTAISMELTVDGMRELRLDYEAGFDEAGNLENMLMELQVVPFTLSLDMKQTKGVIQVNSSWKKEGNPLLSSYFLIARNNLNFTAYDDFTFTGKTSGYIKYRDMKLDGSFDFSGVEIEKADKGEAVQMALYQGSRKLGKLYIDFQTDGEQYIPGSVQYFIDCSESNERIPADCLIKPLFNGFNDIL